MSSTVVRAFQPPAFSMVARRQMPAVPLKLKNAPVANRAYCSHLTAVVTASASQECEKWGSARQGHALW